MRRRSSRAERGASLTEAAVLVPLLVATLVASLVLADLGLAALWPREVARYAAFAAAGQPLSDLASGPPTQAAHDAAFARARLVVGLEAAARYRDLDGARGRRHSAGELQTLTAKLDALRITSAAPGVVPLAHERAWPWDEPQGALAVALQWLGLGAGPDDALGAAARAGGLDARGLVRVDAAVGLEAPAGVDPTAGAARVGAARLAASMTLIADPWRVLDGRTAEPRGPEAGAPSTNPSFGNVVSAVDDRIAAAWPLGPVILRLVDARPPPLPPGVRDVLGMPAFAPATHLVSRPYSGAGSEPAGRSRGELPGQVDVFALTRARAEPGATTTFDTLPGAVRDLHARRGRWFLGCLAPEQQECAR